MTPISDDLELIAVDDDELTVEQLPDSDALSSFFSATSASTASCPGSTAATASTASTLG